MLETRGKKSGLQMRRSRTQRANGVAENEIVSLLTRLIGLGILYNLVSSTNYLDSLEDVVASLKL